MELLADEEADEEGILDDGELEGSVDIHYRVVQTFSVQTLITP